jgi:hypothetical protein
MKLPPNKNTKYYLNPQGEFVIENYDLARPFASFFPGIAGKYGIPMWVFYVNRGQAIASFGTRDKDHCILEFFPANKTWEFVGRHGFRTFIKITSANKTVFYEPFSSCSRLEFNTRNSMSIASHGLKIEEENLTLGLKIKIEYFTIPGDSFAALARIVTVQNTSKQTKDIQLLDGLPAIVPSGVSNLFLKKLGRTIEAWMKVKNLDNGVALFKLDVDPTDRPQVIRIDEGNFFLGLDFERSGSAIVKPIVDPQQVFGPMTDYSYPRSFLTPKNFTQPRHQITESKTPCAFIFLKFKVRAGQVKTFSSLTGNMRNIETLNTCLPRITSPGYLNKKKLENQKLIADLQSEVETESASREFNLYAKQTYLDNIIRGGYPVIFKHKDRQTTFYLYSRKHGDLERDYNKFSLQPSYFSQGNGNYRDMNQNRRSDIWFNPEIKDENVITLFNLIQSDGYNPLVVKGSTFTCNDVAGLSQELKNALENQDLLKLMNFLTRPYSPGEAIFFLRDHKIKLKILDDEFLNLLLNHSVKNVEAEHGEGFWTDHWTYNLDLLESYLSIYPENLREIIFEKKAFTFFDNSETVKPRSQKYTVKDNRVWQYHSLIPDGAKKEIMRKRTDRHDIARADFGKGQIYQTILMNKLLCLLVNKFACLDPFGVGIEMEADKPNWFDSLNGLPGLLGSSLNETLELKRLVLFIKDVFAKTASERISLTEEISEFLFKLDNATKSYFASENQEKNYQYWDQTHCLKEEYRHKTRMGFSGREKEVGFADLNLSLNNFLKKIDQGIDRAYDKNKKVYYSYFINEVVKYEKIDDHFVRPLKFLQKKLPLFLEGQYHALKVSDDLKKAKEIYEATKKSQLYDKKLKMYKVTAPLKSMPEEIGRCRVFTPGWLENESIWLHMEYKYLLEILKKKLYRQFYADFKNVLIPFQKPASYGRSILENSSFLVSSAFPDKNLHGNGFVARLSGSTAEFLNIWLTINIGNQPFSLDENGQLCLRFSPILMDWLFKKKDSTYSFCLLGKTKVTYFNPKKKNTFGPGAVKPKRITFKDAQNNPITINGDTIPSVYAKQIRSQLIGKIEIHLS